MKLGKSPYSFVANSDGSLSFVICISGVIPSEHVSGVLEDLQKRLTSRMRFDETAVQLDDVIAAMPKQCGDDFVVASLLAISM